MIVAIRTSLCLLTLATTTLAACQLTCPHDESTLAAAPPAADPPLPSDRSVDFAGSGAVAARPPSIISVYGERVDHAGGADGFGDGAANLDQVTYASEGHVFDPDVDASGRWIVFASTQHRTTSDIYLKSGSGSTITQLTSDPADDMMPEFSPDGRWVAFTSNRAGNFDIYVMPVDGGQARLVTGDVSDEIHPSWSPDGQRLVYSRFAEQSRRWEMWVVELANTSTHSFLDYGFLPEWCPEPAQSKIVFQRARERGSLYHSIWTIDLLDGEGRNPTEIISAANAALINPGWSSDGRRIVFAAVVDPDHSPGAVPSNSELWTVNLDGTGRVNLAGGTSANFQPTWGAGGRVYFVSDRSGHDNIWSVTAGPNFPANDGSPGASFANAPADN